jgi:hypothetical protein
MATPSRVATVLDWLLGPVGFEVFVFILAASHLVRADFPTAAGLFALAWLPRVHQWWRARRSAPGTIRPGRPGTIRVNLDPVTRAARLVRATADVGMAACVGLLLYPLFTIWQLRDRLVMATLVVSIAGFIGLWLWRRGAHGGWLQVLATGCGAAIVVAGALHAAPLVAHADGMSAFVTTSLILGWTGARWLLRVSLTQSWLRTFRAAGELEPVNVLAPATPGHSHSASCRPCGAGRPSSAGAGSARCA